MHEIRDLICTILDFAGYATLPARNGWTALEVAKTFGGRIDLLLTDVDLPGMDGLDLANNLERLHPDMRTVFISGTYDQRTSEIVGGGASRSFLLKPFSREELLQTVGRVLRARL